MYVIFQMKKKWQIWYIFFNTQTYNLFVKKNVKIFVFYFKRYWHSKWWCTCAWRWKIGLKYNFLGNVRRFFYFPVEHPYRMFFSGLTDGQKHVQLKTVVRNLTKINSTNKVKFTYINCSCQLSNNQMKFKVFY